MWVVLRRVTVPGFTSVFLRLPILCLSIGDGITRLATFNGLTPAQSACLSSRLLFLLSSRYSGSILVVSFVGLLFPVRAVSVSVHDALAQNLG